MIGAGDWQPGNRMHHKPACDVRQASLTRPAMTVCLLSSMQTHIQAALISSWFTAPVMNVCRGTRRLTHLHDGHGQEGLPQERDAGASTPIVPRPVISTPRVATVPATPKPTRVIIVLLPTVTPAAAINLPLLLQPGAGQAVVGREDLSPVGHLAAPVATRVY